MNSCQNGEKGNAIDCFLLGCPKTAVSLHQVLAVVLLFLLLFSKTFLLSCFGTKYQRWDKITRRKQDSLLVFVIAPKFLFQN